MLVVLIGGHYVSKEENNNISYEGKLVINYLDVGQGDSSFIELPNGKTMLIDAGNPENGEDIRKYIKSKNYSKIDYLVATHPHSDHIGGMEKIIKNLEIGKIYMPEVAATTDIFYDLLTAIDNKNLTIQTAKSGVNILSEDDLSIDILSPAKERYEEINNYSAVIMIKYKNNKFLFMGDAEKIIEKEIYDMDIKADVLKVGHHGSRTSSGKTFINKVSPTYSVISVGRDNSYNHPNKNVIQTLKNTNILRTDESGNITIVSDGKEITYYCENNL